jgi:hypothetical protein
LLITIVRRNNFVNFTTQRFVGHPAEHPLGAFIPGRHDEPLVCSGDRVVYVFQQVGVVGELLLGLFALCYVPRVDRQTLLRWVGVHLDPPVSQRGVHFVLHGLLVAERTVKLLIGRSTDGVGV